MPYDWLITTICDLGDKFEKIIAIEVKLGQLSRFSTWRFFRANKQKANVIGW